MLLFLQKKVDGCNYIGFGVSLVEIWEDGFKVHVIEWETFKKNLIKYL